MILFIIYMLILNTNMLLLLNYMLYYNIDMLYFIKQTLLFLLNMRLVINQMLLKINYVNSIRILLFYIRILVFIAAFYFIFIII